jgi:hypothetical protein
VKATSKSKLGVFDKILVDAKQLHSAADRRLGDASHLHASKENARVNGTIYLAGLAVECALKALVLEKHGWKPHAVDRDSLSKEEQRVWKLLFKHSLSDLLVLLPKVQEKVALRDRIDAPRRWGDINRLCAAWSTFIRYTPLSASRDQAEAYVGLAREVRSWL